MSAIKNKNYISGTAMIALSIFVIYKSLQFPEAVGGGSSAFTLGPSFFPILLSILIAVCGLVTVFQGIKDKTIFIYDLSQVSNRRRLYILGLIIGYILVIKFLGFVISTIILLICNMKILRVKTFKASIIAIITVMVISYLFGSLLNVPLPKIFFL